jgi:hypothetical protein
MMFYDDYLETDVPSTKNDMTSTSKPLGWGMRHLMSFYISFFPRLQIWHLRWLVFILSVCHMHSQVPLALHLVFHGDAAAVFEKHYRLNDVDQHNKVRIPVH